MVTKRKVARKAKAWLRYAGTDKAFKSLYVYDSGTTLRDAKSLARMYGDLLIQVRVVPVPTRRRKA